MIDPGTKVKWKGVCKDMMGTVIYEQAPGYYVVQLPNGTHILVNEDNLKVVINATFRK